MFLFNDVSFLLLIKAVLLISMLSIIYCIPIVCIVYI